MAETATDRIDRTRHFKKGEIKAVIFDLDDTLYPEMDYVRSGFSVIARLIARKYDLDSDDCYEGLMQTMQRGISGKNFNIFLEEKKLDYSEGTIVELVREYRNHIPDISLPDETVKTLVSLKDAGIALGLLTDGYLEAQQHKVESLALERHFHAIVYTDAIGRKHWKPSTKPFLDIVSMLEVESSSCVYIADNPDKDFRGARECGMLGVQTLQWVQRDADAVPEPYRPNMIIRDITLIPGLFVEGKVE